LVGGEDGVLAFDLIHGAAHQESGGGIFPRGIARNLLADELVEREVLVESADDVVAVGPCVFADLIHFKSMALGETGDIQPVASPTLSEMRGVEEVFDEFFVGCRLWVGDEGVDFLGGRREAEDVEVGASNEGSTVRFRGKGKALGREFLGDEVIQGDGDGEGLQGFEGPVKEALVDGGGPVGVGLGPWGTCVDPLAQQIHFGGREAIAFRRHLLFGVGGKNAGEERAFGALAGEDGRAAFAALEGVGSEVEAKAALLLFVSVTFDAVFLEEGSNVGLEEGGFEGGGGDAGGCAEGDGREEEGECGQEAGEWGERAAGGEDSHGGGGCVKRADGSIGLYTIMGEMSDSAVSLCASDPHKSRVVSGLLQGIIQGHWKGGDRITEAEAVGRFAVSRTPVREALLELASLGMVVLKRNCGAVFLPFEEAQVRELYGVRSVLEEAAARLAAERMAPERVGQLLSQCERLSPRGRDHGWRLDREIHASIAAAGGNRRLEGEISRYGQLVQSVRDAAGMMVPNLHGTTRLEHMAILEAIERRDGEGAARAMRRHLQQSADTAVEALMRSRGG
jgi:DNA-binding GntR family transcriptional regulator